MKAPASRRHMPVWAWVLIAAAVLACLIPVGLLAAGVIGYGAVASQSGTESDQDRDRAFTVKDAAGAQACDALDSWMVAGIGSWEHARTLAAQAATAAVKDAQDPKAMHAACEQAGANMSEWREPPR